MPGDIIGTNMIVEDRAQGTREFRFQRGPIFAQIILADEINRATPKTQSAMLEAMQEHSVTVGETTYKLKEPFFVMATQNPIELEGTYPLPEAQMDRFLFKLKIVYPTSDEMHEIMNRTTQVEEPQVKAVLEQGEVLEMRRTVLSVPIARSIQDYAIRLTLATHPNAPQSHPLTNKYVRFGASPRGTQALVLGGKVQALLNDRAHVSAEDIRAVAYPALRHRMLLNFEGEAEHVDTDVILKEILKDTPDPGSRSSQLAALLSLRCRSFARTAFPWSGCSDVRARSESPSNASTTSPHHRHRPQADVGIRQYRVPIGPRPLGDRENAPGLRSWTCGDHFFADVRRFREPHGERLYAEGAVWNRPALERLLEDRAPFFARFGVTPSAHPLEVTLAVEYDETVARYQGYGYLYGYPEYAVEYFAEAEITREGRKCVERDFFSVPTYARPDGAYLGGPEGHMENEVDRKILEGPGGARGIPQAPRAISAREAGVSNCCCWFDDGTGRCDLTRAVASASASYSDRCDREPDELVGFQILLRLEPDRISRRALDRRDDGCDVGEVGVLVGDVDRRGTAGASRPKGSEPLDRALRPRADETAAFLGVKELAV
jgi:MoxR-like ATPase